MAKPVRDEQVSIAFKKDCCFYLSQKLETEKYIQKEGKRKRKTTILCNVQSSHAQAALLEASTVYCTAIKDGPKTNG